MKTINVYLSKEQKLKLDRIRTKYKVSMSTLTGKVVYWTYYVLRHYGENNELLTLMQKDYIQKNGNYKTSCKPRELLETLKNEITNKNLFASNCLVIYLEKTISKYIANPKGVNKYYNEIDEALQKSYDIYWDYNNSIRNQRRMIRQNKEYWKKALEES